MIRLLAAAALLVVATALRAPRDRPNIVLFFVDDLGYGDLGFTGHPTTVTPAMDRLASTGKRLTQWYSGYPVCTSSRTALLTGRQPSRVGMVGVINSLSVAGLPLTEVTLADDLRSAGYKSMALGKWHLGQGVDYLPTNRGFDQFLGLPFSVDDGEGFAPPCGPNTSSMPSTDSHIGASSGLGPSLPLPLIRQRGRVESVIVEQPTNLRLLNARLTEAAIQFTSGLPRDQPFFVYFAFGHVHTATPNVDPASNPYEGKQYAACDSYGLSRRGLFGDALTEVDQAVGSLSSHITDTLGLGSNTLTLFLSDNGPSIRWGLAAGSVGPFTGQAAQLADGTSYSNCGKGSVWEGGIRMPAFAHWPGVIAPHSASSEIVSTMDILPSMLSLAGDAVPPSRLAGRVLDGKASLAAILLDNSTSATHPKSKSAHTFLPFYNNPYIVNASTEIFAARYGPYKAHWITSPGLGGGRYPTPGDQHDPLSGRKFAPMRRHEPPLLFNVEFDPSESLPILAPPLALLAELAQAKTDYEASLPIPAPIDPRFGYEWALCCGVGCKAPCLECQCSNVTLPQPAHRLGSVA